MGAPDTAGTAYVVVYEMYGHAEFVMLAVFTDRDTAETWLAGLRVGDPSGDFRLDEVALDPPLSAAESASY